MSSIHSFIHLLIHWLIIIHLLIVLIIYPFIYSFIHLIIHSLTHWPLPCVPCCRRVAIATYGWWAEGRRGSGAWWANATCAGTTWPMMRLTNGSLTRTRRATPTIWNKRACAAWESRREWPKRTFTWERSAASTGKVGRQRKAREADVGWILISSLTLSLDPSKT